MMNLFFKVILSLSVSSSLLILILLAGKRFLKNKFSRQWQYYIWLVVVLRLLFPFGPEINLMGSVYQTFDRTVTQTPSLAGQENSQRDADDFAVSFENAAQEIQEPGQEKTGLDEKQPESRISVLRNGIGWLWLLIALGMLIRKITAYQSFVRYVSVGAEPVFDSILLEEFFAVTKQMGVNRRVELRVNPLLASPTLTGIFHPCIVLPNADVSPKDFRYIVMHELTHCKRWDICYKWLVQFVVCLHWFNPLVYIMSQEINNACEFSCDEAVMEKTGYENAQDYGRTLLDAMAAVGKYRESSTVATLSANKVLLKERLGAIMSYGEKSGTVRILTAVLTVCMILGAVFAGAYPIQADAAEVSETEEPTAGSRPILFDRLEKDEEKDEWKEELEKKQMEEYRAVGVTKEGKNYYYQGQLVNIFLDMRPNYSFYTLDINPAGTVNVKIMHREDGQITGAAYLSEEEFAELFGDMEEEGEDEYPRVMYVNCHVCKVRDGAGEEFSVVGLMAAEEEVTVLGMVEGSGGRNWYRVDKESLTEDMDISVEECYIRADLLREK